MDSFAKQPSSERRIYFEQAAAKDGRMSAQLIEKDFWVCWTLRRLFQLPEISGHLTFKGGTSLSKVYGVIERFSEDVDLSIEREHLGFGGESEPERGKSGKDIQRRLDRLKESCQTFVANSLYPELKNAIRELLAGDANWDLTLDADDPDHQSIRFEYPPAIETNLSHYFAQSVKIELGARSDHYPVESATILHAICHRPAAASVGVRQSRHYYDLFQLSNSHAGQRALQQFDLLERVATHKSIFFKAAWARYDLAKPGSMRLVPSNERIKELRNDYHQMEPMLFGGAPDFDVILERLRHLEESINGR